MWVQSFTTCGEFLGLCQSSRLIAIGTDCLHCMSTSKSTVGLQQPTNGSLLRRRSQHDQNSQQLHLEVDWEPNPAILALTVPVGPAKLIPRLSALADLLVYQLPGNPPIGAFSWLSTLLFW